MGESRRNPRSPQYTGPLPDFAIQPVLGYRLVPSVAWMEANKEALERGDSVPMAPEDCDLEIVACAAMAYPSRFIPDPRNWRQAAADVDVIARRPFKEFKAEVDAKIEGETPSGASSSPPGG